MRNNQSTSSFSSSANSSVIDLRLAFALSMQTISGASATGSVKIQVSNDNANTGPATASTSWVDLPSASITIVSGTTQLLPKIDVCYNWARVVVTYGGTGAIVVNVKALGQ